MSDFSTNGITLQYNTGADSAAGASWTGNTLQFGGSGNGFNELRWAISGASSTTASAIWPFITRPASGALAITQLWAFSGDTSGAQVSTYDGTNSHSFVLKWTWDNSGTFAAPPQFSAFGDNTHTAPTPGVQPPAVHNDAITNGSSDTSNTSYLKIAAFGYGADASGNQQTPSSGGGLAGSTPSVTTGTNNAVVTSASAWSTWQSAQGWLQYLANGTTPKAQTAGSWYWTTVLFTGVNMSTGVWLPVLTFQYAYS